MSERKWTITLNEYQRNNLLLMFNVFGYPHGNPHHVQGLPGFNTGDWFGEIPIMLGTVLGPDERANVTADDYRTGERRAEAINKAQGAAEELKRASDFINGRFEYKGSWSRFVVTLEDNVKSTGQCYDFNDAADDVCCEIVEALERGDHS